MARIRAKARHGSGQNIAQHTGQTVTFSLELPGCIADQNAPKP
jgi:hypothetical protein